MPHKIEGRNVATEQELLDFANWAFDSGRAFTEYAR